MIERVTATRFHQRLTTGRNVPLILECEKAHGTVLVAAKLSSSPCGVNGLIRECYASLLARDLGLTVADPYVVEISEEFIASIPRAHPEARAALSAASRCAFACEYLGGGYSVWPAQKSIPSELFEAACEIFAFDGLIYNSDRRANKPNLLSNGDKLLILDHELAFEIGLLGTALLPYPWTPGSLAFMSESPQEHLFANKLKGKAVDLSRLEAAWTAITDAQIAQYATFLPDDWSNGAVLPGSIYDYLCLLGQNLPAALTEIRRVLT